MGKILSLLIGTVVGVLGIVLFVMWWYEFLFMLRGFVPIMLIFGGAIAVIAGVSELKDSIKSEKK